MARPERVLDPEAGPLQQFAHDLVQLRKNASGIATLQDLADRSGYSRTALSDACSGQKLPSRDLLEAYVGACGGDLKHWLERWEELAAKRSAPVAVPAGEMPAPPEEIPPPDSAQVERDDTESDGAESDRPETQTQTQTDQEAAEPAPAQTTGNRRWNRRSLAVPILIAAVIVAAVLLARHPASDVPDTAPQPGPQSTDTSGSGPTSDSNPGPSSGNNTDSVPQATQDDSNAGNGTASSTAAAFPSGTPVATPTTTDPRHNPSTSAPTTGANNPSSSSATSAAPPAPAGPITRTLGPGPGSCGVQMANDDGSSFWNWSPVEGYTGTCVPYYTRQSGIAAGKSGAWKADAQWEFTNLATPGKSITCTVSVYIPNAGRADAEALYNVYDRPGENIQNLIDYAWITQNQHRGSWVQISGQSTATFTTTSGYLDLVIADPNNNTTGSAKTITADAAKLTCS